MEAPSIPRTPRDPALVAQEIGAAEVEKDFNPASATNGGREISRKVLYVGGLPKTVNEDALSEKFSASGPVFSVKVLNDKNKHGFNYAFIEFVDEPSAAAALLQFNGTSLENSVLCINYAYQSSTFNASQNPEDLTYNIFVGDLSPEVDDEALQRFFSVFESLKQAHVMWDMQTSRSRGYGFVTFTNLSDAEMALQTMNGKILNGRAIRCNWASHKQQNNRSSMRQNAPQRQFRPQYARPGFVESNGPMQEKNAFADGQFSLPQRPQHEPQIMPNLSMGPSGGVMSPHSFDIVLRQTPSWQTTVYLGNIAHFTQQNDLIPLLQNFGYIVDFKFHPEKGCAFVKYDTHERAALAIVQLSGFNVNGRPLKCGWGKSRPPMAQGQNYPRN